MTAFPGSEFPNPCPVCGNSDDHADFRAGNPGFGATFCPHPAERGHGTGCCCGGMSRETAKRRMDELLSAPSPLEQRVAALEEAVERLSHPLMITEFPGELDEAELKRFRADLEAVKYQPLRVLPSSLTVLDPENVRQLLRECVTVVKPGETLVVQVPMETTPWQVRELQDALNAITEDRELGFTVLIVPGCTLGVAEDDGS